MIVASLTLMRKLIRETERICGSQAELIFYDGIMPSSTEAQAEGNRVAACVVPDNFVADAFYGDEPQLLLGTSYWRILDNGGRCMLQGDNR